MMAEVACVVDYGSYQLRAGLSHNFPNAAEPRLVSNSTRSLPRPELQQAAVLGCHVLSSCLLQKTDAACHNTTDLGAANSTRAVREGQVVSWDTLSKLLSTALHEQVMSAPFCAVSCKPQACSS